MEDEAIDSTPASEEVAVDQDTSSTQEEPRMVPLSALEAERRKRQDVEAQNRLLQEQAFRPQANLPEEDPEEDAEELLNRGQFKQEHIIAKREIREEVFKDMNPKAIEQIKQYLNPILEKKPWLADSIKGSDNRYARAYEIVEDYKHLIEPKQSNYKTDKDGTKIVQNANKPGSPVQNAKASPTSNMAYLKSIQGTAEFRNYRQKAIRGEL